MLRTIVFLLAWFAFLVAAIALAARFVPVANHAVLILAALSPYLVLAAGLVALPVLVTPWRWAAVPTLVLVTVAAALQAPLFLAHPPGNSVEVRVLTANLREGFADPAALTALARDRADLLVVQELTPALAGNLHGLDAEFPYRALDARPVASGVGIWSRHPIVGSSRNPGYELGMVTASLRVPGTPDDVVVLAAHLVGPWPQAIGEWRTEIGNFPETLRATANSAPGAVIVAGDLNATYDMLPFRRILRSGFRDAGEQAGAGFVRTFPADGSAPPLIGIDHILTYKSSATDLRTVAIPGSDHLGLCATVHLPG